jgi:hypothetical protein
MTIIKNKHPNISIEHNINNQTFEFAVIKHENNKICLICDAKISYLGNDLFNCKECNMIFEIKRNSTKFYCEENKLISFDSRGRGSLKGFKCFKCKSKNMKDIGFVDGYEDHTILYCRNCATFIEWFIEEDIFTDADDNVLHNGGFLQCIRCRKKIKDTYSEKDDEEEVECPRCRIRYSVRYPFIFEVTIKDGFKNDKVESSHKKQLYFQTELPLSGLKNLNTTVGQNRVIQNKTSYFAHCPICGCCNQFYVLDCDTYYEGLGYSGIYMLYFLLCGKCHNRSYVSLEGRKAIKGLSIKPVPKKVKFSERCLEITPAGVFECKDMWIDEELDGEFCEDDESVGGVHYGFNDPDYDEEDSGDDDDTLLDTGPIWSRRFALGLSLSSGKEDTQIFDYPF